MIKRGYALYGDLSLRRNVESRAYDERSLNTTVRMKPSNVPDDTVGPFTNNVQHLIVATNYEARYSFARHGVEDSW